MQQCCIRQAMYFVAECNNKNPLNVKKELEILPNVAITPTPTSGHQRHRVPPTCQAKEKFTSQWPLGTKSESPSESLVF